MWADLAFPLHPDPLSLLPSDLHQIWLRVYIEHVSIRVIAAIFEVIEMPRVVASLE